MSAFIARITSRDGVPCVEFIARQSAEQRFTIEEWTFERARAHPYPSYELAAHIAQRLTGAFAIVVFPPEQPETTTKNENPAARHKASPS